jgi:muconolactone delta-isomerase
MRFLVETTLKSAPTPEVLALIPAEVEHGKMLDARGVRERLYVAADQSKAWQVVRGESTSAVEQILGGFPLYPFLDVKITPLADAM